MITKKILMKVLNSLGEDYRDNKQYLKKLIESQKIEDMISINIIEWFKQNNQLIDLDIKTLENLLAEDWNIWLKGELCDTLCIMKKSDNPDLARIYSDISLIQKDLEEQKKDEDQIKNGSKEVIEEIKLTRVWLKRPTFDTNKKRY